MDVRRISDSRWKELQDFMFSAMSLHSVQQINWARGGVVVKALRYKPAGRGVDSRWCHWNFSVT
jgi:hypothetical protein